MDEKYRNYDEKYWDKKVFAPSSLIYYLGINKKINNLDHHTLFFDEDLNQHAVEIYKTPMWPTKPLFYVCCPSKTDDEIGEWGDKENPYITEFYYYEFDGDYDENGVPFIYLEKEYYEEKHSTMSFRNQSPILLVSDYGSFTDMFDDYWKKPMKQWFEDKYKLPVKTIVAD